MKISGWIKLIGILCIVFGAYRIMSAGTELLILQMDEIVPGFFKPEFLIYIEILVNTVYVLAGVFFLMTKSFSLKLMYFALILKIVYGISSVLIIKFTVLPVINIALELVNPLFNSIMLFGVIKLDKYYFKSKEELSGLFEKKIQRSSVFTQPLLKVLSIGGIMFLSVPLLIFILRIFSSVIGTTHAESVTIFNSYLPMFLQEQFASAYISLILCLFGVVLGIISLKLRKKLWITLNVFVLVLSSMIFLLNLWTLL